MPKRNRKRKKTVHFSEAEHLLIGLDKVFKSGSSDASTAKSLRDWWITHKSWTHAQWNYAKVIVGKLDKKPAKKRRVKYYVYAISDGEHIKIGFSGNTGARLKAIQTGHPKPLKCVWKFYAGTSAAAARTTEKKLHRRCKKHKIRGEWFGIDCMHLIESFSANNERECKRIEEELDREALRDSPLIDDVIMGDTK